MVDAQLPHHLPARGLPVRFRHLRTGSHPQAGVSRIYDPSGRRGGRLSGRHERRGRRTAGQAARTVPDDLQGGEAFEDHLHLAERHVLRDGRAERRRERQGRSVVEDQARPCGVQDAASRGRCGARDERRLRRHLGPADHPRIGHAVVPRAERVHGRPERPSAPHRVGLEPAALRRSAGADFGICRSRPAGGLRHRREGALRGAGFAGADPGGRLGEQRRDRNADPYRAVAGRGARGRGADRLERPRRPRPACEGRGARRARIRRSGQLYPQQRPPLRAPLDGDARGIQYRGVRPRSRRGAARFHGGGASVRRRCAAHRRSGQGRRRLRAFVPARPVRGHGHHHSGHDAALPAAVGRRGGRHDSALHLHLGGRHVFVRHSAQYGDPCGAGRRAGHDRR